MKSIAIFLILTFITGFQAAVLTEEPPPSNSEANQSIMEQLQDQFGKATERINEGLETMKGHATELLIFAVELGKKMNVNKILNRKFSYMGSSFYNQGREVMNDQYKKATDLVVEIKANPTLVALHEEMIEPAMKKGSQVVSWVGDQSLTSLYNLLQKAHKKMSFP